MCPFTAVVFQSDLRRLGDVRQLEGRSVQIQGRIEQYDGRRAGIILKKPEQLGEAASLPPPLTRDAA